MDPVEEVVERLTHGTPIAREQAAHALQNLAYNNEENQVAIAAAGGIAPLVELDPGGRFRLQLNRPCDSRH